LQAEIIIEDFLKDLPVGNVLVLAGYHRFKRCGYFLINARLASNMG
jgi:hypothetical protein